MLARSTYEHAKRDIQEHANTYTTQLRAEIEAETSLHRAVLAANRIARSYHQDLTTTMFTRLHEVGNNAVEYYGEHLSEAERAQEVSLAMDELVHSPYYGLTLPQRLKQSHIVLRHNIRRSSVVGAKKEVRIQNLIRVFNDSYPFGAQKSWDTRLFLAEAVRLEHVIARNLAIRKAYKLVRWALSGTHKGPDICDQLAHTVDPKVEKYLKEQKFDLKPEGVYFLKSVPAIPHPNCQCTLEHIHRLPKVRKRKPEKKLNLIQRILRAIFK